MTRPERKCTECNEARTSFLSFCVTVCLCKGTDILFLPQNKRPLSTCIRRPKFKLADLYTILCLCNTADKSPYNSFSLCSYTQFHSTDHNVCVFFFFFLSLRGCCISSSRLALCLRLAEAIYSSPSPSASPVGLRREEGKKERKRRRKLEGGGVDG